MMIDGLLLNSRKWKEFRRSDWFVLRLAGDCRSAPASLYSRRLLTISGAQQMVINQLDEFITNFHVAGDISWLIPLHSPRKFGLSPSRQLPS